MARERAAKYDDDTSGGEFAAIEASGSLPGMLGVVAVGVTSVVLIVRRRLRRA